MPDTVIALRRGIGLQKMGVFNHDFSSTPMLFNSSELIFEMSRSAPARVRNKSRQTNKTKTSMEYLLSTYIY
jgi:hypothetical protein